MSPQELSRKKCFVVSVIGDENSSARMHADCLLEKVIEPVMLEFSDFDLPIRADKIAEPGMINGQVFKYLLHADLVIADLSHSNPNVFYEVGIRHMVQKPIIHMQLKDERIPFDVSGYRAIKFLLGSPKDLEEVQRHLKAAVTRAAHAEYRVENPLTHAVDQMHSVQQLPLSVPIHDDSVRRSDVAVADTFTAGVEIDEPAEWNRISKEIDRELGNHGCANWAVRMQNSYACRIGIKMQGSCGDDRELLIKAIREIKGVKSAFVY